jgi:pimeloyl-ACP methyl ester carboxylesterase
MAKAIKRLYIIVALVGLAYYFVWRPKPLAPMADPRPAQEYAEAMARAAALQARDGPHIKTVCRTQLLSHGKRTPTAVVLLHGYSSSPHQYHILAAQLFARGHNVIIPRFPYHGHLSRRAKELWRLQLEDALETTQEAVDIAQGLGEHVVVVGLSFGGALTAWLAQQRPDIDRAVIVSPAFAFHSVEPWPIALVGGIARTLPPFFAWWDPELREAGGPYHAYAGWSTRGGAVMMQLGLLLAAETLRRPPRTKSLAVVINPADVLLNLKPAYKLVEAWRKHGAAVDVHIFPKEWALRHDCIEPDVENAQIERVYPVIIELAEKREPAML